MINKPVIPIRFASGSLAGVNLIASKNTDGSVSFNDTSGQVQTVSVPYIKRGSFAAGSGPLPTPNDPVIITTPQNRTE